jgi:hypothetical protein
MPRKIEVSVGIPSNAFGILPPIMIRLTLKLVRWFIVARLEDRVPEKLCFLTNLTKRDLRDQIAPQVC